MRAFLFVWNPEKWKWHDLDEKINVLQNTGTVSERWSCVSHKKIKEGDRAFLLQLGKGVKTKGVFASGYVTSAPFLSPHWADKNKLVHRVYIDFDVLLNPEKEEILDIDLLAQGNLAKQTWLPQASGISIKEELIDELERLWFSFLKGQHHRFQPFLSLPKFTEGNQNQVLTTRYERNPHARKTCLKYYGYSCQVCGINFEERYGEIGKDFIHVHHQIMLSDADGEREIDPVKDLIPVCPNCHAMLHQKKPPYRIEELKIKIRT